MNTYLSVHDFLRAPTGQETASLLGNLLRIATGGVAQGATSLPVTPGTTLTLNPYDPITIFDGSNTEVVTVTGSSPISPGAISIPVSALQYAHAAGTSCCSDGRLGSLAEAIIEGSAEVERICRQPLLQATYTNEQLPLQSTRAWIDSSLQLGVRPLQFPVQSVSAISLVFSPSSTMQLDTTQLLLDSVQRIVTVSVLKGLGNGNTYPYVQYIDQTAEGLAQLTYVAGYAYTSLPPIIKRAATLLTSDILSDRANPTGAAVTQEGKLKQETFLRGDLSGESALKKRARSALKPYTQDAW